LSFAQFPAVTRLAIFAITLPSNFLLARRKQLLSANTYFASGGHGEKAKTEA